MLLIVEGDQVPLILLLDTNGKIGVVSPLHNGAIVVKVGVILVFIVTLIVRGEAHELATGVKV